MDEQRKHLGTVGKRDRWIASFTGSKVFDSTDFRTGDPVKRYLHKFEVDGSVAIWWTGKPLTLEISEQVVIVGTVKLHDIYQPRTPVGLGKPINQTVLSRVDVHPVSLCEACGGALIDKDKKCPTCKVRVGQTEMFM